MTLETLLQNAERCGPCGCLIWLGHKMSSGYGYGRVAFRGGNRLAHRVVYELARGPIPKELEIDHLCRVQSCINPDHLEAVTHSVNMRRGVIPSVVALRRGVCKEGHPLIPENV